MLHLINIWLLFQASQTMKQGRSQHQFWVHLFIGIVTVCRAVSYLTWFADNFLNSSPHTWRILSLYRRRWGKSPVNVTVHFFLNCPGCNQTNYGFRSICWLTVARDQVSRFRTSSLLCKEDPSQVPRKVYLFSFVLHSSLTAFPLKDGLFITSAQVSTGRNTDSLVNFLGFIAELYNATTFHLDVDLKNFVWELAKEGWKFPSSEYYFSLTHLLSQVCFAAYIAGRFA